MHYRTLRAFGLAALLAYATLAHAQTKHPTPPVFTVSAANGNQAVIVSDHATCTDNAGPATATCPAGMQVTSSQVYLSETSGLTAAQTSQFIPQSQPIVQGGQTVGMSAEVSAKRADAHVCYRTAMVCGHLPSAPGSVADASK